MTGAPLSTRSSADIRIRTSYEHGQFYAVARGREVARLKRRKYRWWRRYPAVASAGPTPEAAIADVARLLHSLRRWESR